MGAGDRLRWTLIGLVLAFEGVVGVLALNPRVSEPFRAYYIDRTSDCWPLPITGQFELGKTLSFLAGSPDPVHHNRLCGWIDPEATGTWSVGNEARLRFRVPFAPSDVLLELDLLPFTAEGLPEQTVLFTVNGTPLEVLRLGPFSTGLKYFRIPRQVLLDNWGRLDLEMRFPNAQAPVTLGVNNDRRKLAVRIISARLTLAEGAAGQSL